MQQALMVVFKSEIERERILKWIEALREKGAIEENMTRLQQFDPAHDMPVLYFP